MYDLLFLAQTIGSCLPSPLRGGIEGGGHSALAPQLADPLPSPPLKGEGETSHSDVPMFTNGDLQ